MSPRLFLLLISVTGVDSSHDWVIPAAAMRNESDCFAPHMHATARYDFSVHSHPKKTGFQHVLPGDDLTGIQAFVSTELVSDKDGRAWLHNIKVQSAAALLGVCEACGAEFVPVRSTWGRRCHVAAWFRVMARPPLGRRSNFALKVGLWQVVVAVVSEVQGPVFRGKSQGGVS